MADETPLHWRRFTDAIGLDEKKKTYEGRDATGAEFMYLDCYSTGRQVSLLVTDSKFIEAVKIAREKKTHFMLEGCRGRGKNIFCELVARGNARREGAVRYTDINLFGSIENQMRDLFDPGGFLDRPQDAILCVDYLENLGAYPDLENKLHKLFIQHMLVLNNREERPAPELRIAGGSMKNDLRAWLASPEGSTRPASFFFDHLYSELCQVQRFQIAGVLDQRGRMTELLEEKLADTYLNPEHRALQHAIEGPLSAISQVRLKELQETPWPAEFQSLRAFVVEAARLGSWDKAPLVDARMASDYAKPYIVTVSEGPGGGGTLWINDKLVDLSKAPSKTMLCWMMKEKWKADFGGQWKKSNREKLGWVSQSDFESERRSRREPNPNEKKKPIEIEETAFRKVVEDVRDSIGNKFESIGREEIIETSHARTDETSYRFHPENVRIVD